VHERGDSREQQPFYLKPLQLPRPLDESEPVSQSSKQRQSVRIRRQQPKSESEPLAFTEESDDSVDSETEVDPKNRKLHKVFVISRQWLLRSNLGLFKIMMDSEESISFFYTPITPKGVHLTVNKQRLAWVAHRVRLKQLIMNIKKVCAEDDWPAETVLFLTYLTD
jgi:hypothetical protein